MKKNVAIMFGGISSEHEVSVISGILIVENIDREKYTPLSIYVDKNGLFYLLEHMKTRKDFSKLKCVPVVFDKTETGTFLVTKELIPKKFKLDLAYLAFHGGIGELGPTQGLLETYEIPYSSPSYESSAICMNKAITKEIFAKYKLPILPYQSFKSAEYEAEPDSIEKEIIKNLGLPVVVKAVHIGSTIGVRIAKTELELKKALMVLTKLDYEILAEHMLVDMVEYNVSVRKNGEEIETSVIERPIKHDELLSFKDKYQSGSKLKTEGMASLDRELPAKISKELETEIIEIAKEAYFVTRCSGTVRIDFMYSDSKLYITEINTIPGCLAFFLWEAKGIPFRDQITQSLEQAEYEMEQRNRLKFQYESDIIEKFTGQFGPS